MYHQNYYAGTSSKSPGSQERLSWCLRETSTCSRAKTYVLLTSLNYVHFFARYCWWRQFLWRPRLRVCKVQKPSINSTWISWSIQRFLPVKTWLLIACDTDFYAIIIKGTRQLVNRTIRRHIFETTRRQIVRQLIDTLWDNSSTHLFEVNWPVKDNYCYF